MMTRSLQKNYSLCSWICSDEGLLDMMTRSFTYAAEVISQLEVWSV
jgi:hypothetical protein